MVVPGHGLICMYVLVWAQCRAGCLCTPPADFEPNPVLYFYDFPTEFRVVINRLTELKFNSIDLLIRIKKFVQEVIEVENGLG